MISSLLHFVSPRLRVYYTLTNFLGRGSHIVPFAPRWAPADARPTPPPPPPSKIFFLLYRRPFCYFFCFSPYKGSFSPCVGLLLHLFSKLETSLGLPSPTKIFTVAHALPPPHNTPILNPRNKSLFW